MGSTSRQRGGGAYSETFITDFQFSIKSSDFNRKIINYEERVFPFLMCIFFNFQITSSISNWSILCGMHKNLVKSPKYGKSWMDEIIGRLSGSLNWDGSVHGGGDYSTAWFESVRNTLG